MLFLFSWILRHSINSWLRMTDMMLGFRDTQNDGIWAVFSLLKITKLSRHFSSRDFHASGSRMDIGSQGSAWDMLTKIVLFMLQLPAIPRAHPLPNWPHARLGKWQ